MAWYLASCLSVLLTLPMRAGLVTAGSDWQVLGFFQIWAFHDNPPPTTPTTPLVHLGTQKSGTAFCAGECNQGRRVLRLLFVKERGEEKKKENMTVITSDFSVPDFVYNGFIFFAVNGA